MKKSTSTNNNIHTTLKRGIIKSNVILQVIFYFIIFILINIISLFTYKQWDISKGKKYTLNPITKKIIKKINDKITINVIFKRKNPLYEEVRSMLEEIKRTNKKNIKIKYIDPYKSLERAKILAKKYDLVIKNDIILIEHKKQIEIINHIDLISDPLAYKEIGTINAFQGEEALCSAILSITEKKKNTIYLLKKNTNNTYLQGKNLLNSYLSKQNVEIKELELTQNHISAQNSTDENTNTTPKKIIPEDTNLIIIYSLDEDLTDSELKILEEYWTKEKSSIMIFLDPNNPLQNINSFITKTGAIPNNDIILKSHSTLGKSINTNYTIPATFVHGPGVPKELYLIDTTLPAWSTSFKLKNNKNLTNKEITPILVSINNDYWGEKNINEKYPIFDKKTDISSPFIIAYSLEKGIDKQKYSLENPNAFPNSSRMIVIGNTSIIDTNTKPRIRNNYDFTIGTINWLLRRNHLIGINPKKYTRYGINIMDKQLFGIIALSILTATIVLVLGLLIRAFRKF